MMQYLWRYVDDLIGKGLSLDVLAQFFWYMGLMLIPEALPLAILLSSLITFGNLGESSELTAIKAAGISLLQAFRSLIFVTALITLGSFCFQNSVAPEAQKKMVQLLAAMKQKSPELEIPEGIFYDGIPNCNLYVQKKDMSTGMLYGVMIYRMTESFEDAAIILADSGRLQSTADKKHLLLSLYAGEWFENMKSQSMMGNANVPYRRETFVTKQIVLDFDAGLNVSEEVFAGDARGKSLKDIKEGLKVTNHALDSIGGELKSDIERQYIRRYYSQKKDTIDGIKQSKAAKGSKLNTDTLYAHLSLDDQKIVQTQTLSEVRMVRDYLAFNGMIAADGQKTIREHYLEWILKYNRSLLCLMFFFIGAPLGAIIRKGGLGVPVIISVIVFVIYYILNETGFRMARIGSWPVWFARGLAPAILIPTAVFLTHKANKDSMVFNFDLYKNIFRRLLGLRLKRSVAMKEVIIHEPDYAKDKIRLEEITERIIAYNHQHKLFMMPNPWKVFFKYEDDLAIESISNDMESVIDDLSNTRDSKIVELLNRYPIVSVKAHTRPFNRRWKNIAALIVLPFGLFLFFRMWFFRIRLLHDLRLIHKLNDEIIK